MKTDRRRRNGKNSQSHNPAFGQRTGNEFAVAAKLTAEGIKRRREWLQLHSERLASLLWANRE